jgi:hypothetical protein
MSWPLDVLKNPSTPAPKTEEQTLIIFDLSVCDSKNKEMQSPSESKSSQSSVGPLQAKR